MGQLVGLPGSGARSPAQPGLQPAAPPPHPPHTNRKQVAKAVTPPAPRLALRHLRLTSTLHPDGSPRQVLNYYKMLRTCRDLRAPGRDLAPRLPPGWAHKLPAPPPADAPFWGSGGSAASRQARARRPGLCRRSAAGAVAGGPARLSRAGSASVCSGTRSRLPHVLLGPRPAPSCGRAPNTAGEGGLVPATSHHGSRTHPPSLPALCLYC